VRPVTSISIWGAHAQRFCDRHARARVVALFARSLHLEADGDFICIGDASIGRGPLNAIVDPAGWARAARHLPAVDAAMQIGDGAMRCDRLTLSTAGASSWFPPPWPGNVERDALTFALQGLARLASEKAPLDGIARVALTVPTSLPASALERVARARIVRVREWVGARLERPRCEPAPLDLLGLGPGMLSRERCSSCGHSPQ
jgi:hypothetical protein